MIGSKWSVRVVKSGTMAAKGDEYLLVEAVNEVLASDPVVVASRYITGTTNLVSLYHTDGTCSTEY